MNKIIRIAASAALLWFLLPMPTLADGPTDLNVLILKLFGEHNNFSVESEFQMIEPGQREPALTLTLSIAVSAGNMRADTDMTRAKGPALTPDTLRQLKASGEDRVISIMRSAENRLLVIYPNKKTYDQADIPKDAARATKRPKIEKTPLANLTLDGHPCVKKRVILTDDSGARQEITVWEAEDLKDFPLQVQLTERGQEMLIHNRNISFGKIDSAQFEVPSGFKKNPPQSGSKNPPRE